MLWTIGNQFHATVSEWLVDTLDSTKLTLRGLVLTTLADLADSTVPSTPTEAAKVATKALNAASAAYRETIPASYLQGLKAKELPSVEALSGSKVQKERRERWDTVKVQFTHLKNVLQNAAADKVTFEAIAKGEASVSKLRKARTSPKTPDQILKAKRDKARKALADLYEYTGDAGEVYTIGGEIVGCEIAAVAATEA